MLNLYKQTLFMEQLQPTFVSTEYKNRQIRALIQILSQYSIQQNCANMMDIEQKESERQFQQFLSRQTITNPHSFVIEINSFRQQHPESAQDLIKNPSKYYRLTKAFLQNSMSNQQGKRRYEGKIQHFNISFQGDLGANFVSPRGLGSKMANELVGVQGIITKMDIVRSQLQKSVHYCEKTNNFEMKEYPDSFNPEKDFELKKTKFIKVHDDNNNPLSFQYGMSSFRDVQTVVIQELPQNAPPGLLPQSVNVVLQGDLVNSVKPGDRVEMIGIYKLIAGGMSKDKGIFKPFFLCLSVRPLNMVISTSKLSSKVPCDESEILSLFSRSIAPSIQGHQVLKKAVLLMLIGGCEKNLENGTHLRGDINLLMVGDPGTAKSQILRYVLSTAELAIGTTGSGASGVGLTAAIVNDRDTGEKTLQAGAMVLADRGVVCIDQFDKMNQTDRVAVHEVMEQQTVTIAKAGMHCSLNARCSVIAAANPIYGEYQTELPPTKNIGMQDSLLSRFDLIFIILDEKNAQKDKKIGDRVCRNHRLAPIDKNFNNDMHEDGNYIISQAQNQKQEENVYDKSNVYKSDTKTEILTQGFLKKYINFCKTNIYPVLSEDAIEFLAKFWTQLREKDFNDKVTVSTKVLPITIRSYETLIRLSTAHAKLRQSKEIHMVEDCEVAARLMAFCLYGSETALDEQIARIKKQVSQEFGIPSKGMDIQTKGKNVKGGSKKEKEAKVDESSKKSKGHDVTKKMAKLQIGQSQKQAQKVIKQSLNIVTFTKKQKSDVFKALTTLRNKTRGIEGIELKDLRKQVNQIVSEDQLYSILNQLEIDALIHTEKNGQRIHVD